MNDRPPIVAGLCSVTFRGLAVGTVARLAADAGLEAIEWGSDVHVPVGDMVAAEAARRESVDRGLSIVSYGTYLAAGRGPTIAEVREVCATATALGAPNVRVWAHGAGAVDDLRMICEEAAAHDLTVSLEFHPGTATETAASTNELLDAVGADNLSTYWQPDPAVPVAQALGDLDAVVPRLSHLHVFTWQPDYTRLPLDAGEDWWPVALHRAASATACGGQWRVALLEFVRDDEPDHLAHDAATLHRWLERLDHDPCGATGIPPHRDGSPSRAR